MFVVLMYSSSVFHVLIRIVFFFAFFFFFVFFLRFCRCLGLVILYGCGLS